MRRVVKEALTTVPVPVAATSAFVEREYSTLCGIRNGVQIHISEQ